MKDIFLKIEDFKKICTEKRWTFTSLAKHSNISRKTLHRWLSSETVPTEKNIRKLAAVLEVPVNKISNLRNEIEKSEAPLSDHLSKWLSISDQMVLNYTETDIIRTKLNNIDKKLNEALTITNAFLYSLDSSIYIKDINNKYLLVNNKFKETLKLNQTYNPRNKTDFDFFPAMEAQINYEQDKEIIQDGKAIKNMKSCIPGTRKKKYGLISKYPIMDSKNKIEGLICLIIDGISDKKIKTQELLC